MRFTNRDVICQVIYATIAGDITICAAYAHELPKFGMKAGLTNYAAAYATGLLCARRLLTKYGLAETYEGNTENIGEDYNVEAEGDRRPFKCFLDVGLVRTSTGARVFAALKGAVDGGLDIPHNDKRYAGYDLQDKSLDSETLERYIKGGVVAEYAEEMQEEVSFNAHPFPFPHRSHLSCRYPHRGMRLASPTRTAPGDGFFFLGLWRTDEGPREATRLGIVASFALAHTHVCVALWECGGCLGGGGGGKPSLMRRGNLGVGGGWIKTLGGKERKEGLKGSPSFCPS